MNEGVGVGIDDPFAELKAYAATLWPALDQYTYYQLLEVAPNADLAAIRTAFYRAAAVLHPDRYVGLDDELIRDQLQTIYARLSEGYRVLTTPEKRVSYDKSLAEGKTRYDATREKKGPQNPEDSVTHAEGKKFLRLGLMAMARKDWKGAAMNLKFAQSFDKAPIIAEKLAEAEAALKKPT